MKKLVKKIAYRTIKTEVQMTHKGNTFKKIFLIICLFFISFTSFISCVDMGWDDQKKTTRSHKKKRKFDVEKREAAGSTVNYDEKKEACEKPDGEVFSSKDCKSEIIAREVNLKNQPNQVKHHVDILFLLDTSSTMHFYYRDHFQHKFKNFISIIDQRLDWHLLYTHTEYFKKKWWYPAGINGKALNLESDIHVLESSKLTRSTPNYENVFLNSITFYPKRHAFDDFDDPECNYPPYCQTGDSRPFTALKASFEVNKHLMRAEADLVVVIVSNSDNNPTDENDIDTDEEEIVTAKQVVKSFNKIYINKRLFVFNIIIRPEDEDCLKFNQDQQALFSSDDVHEGKNLANLAKVGGGNFSICSDNYDQVAQHIVSETSIKSH